MVVVPLVFSPLAPTSWEASSRFDCGFERLEIQRKIGRKVSKSLLRETAHYFRSNWHFFNHGHFLLHFARFGRKIVSVKNVSLPERAGTCRSEMMMRLGITVVLGFAMVAPSMAQDPSNVKRRALVVGVSSYEKTGFASRPLPFASTDMQSLADELKKAGWEVATLISQGTRNEASGVQIRTALDKILKGVNASDLILVALSGHGQQYRAEVETDEGRRSLDEAFFCPSDAIIGEASTMIGMTELTRLLGKLGGKNLVLVDACRDDPRKGGVKGVDGNTVRSLPGNTSILFSCAAGQQSFETNLMFGPNSSRGRGVFFHRVLLGLQGEAKDARGNLTWADLTKYVTDHVNDDAVKWFPERVIVGTDGEKIVQTPHAVGSFVGRSPQLIAPSSSSSSPKPATTAKLADVKLASIFSNNMVLQRNVPLPVWGTSEPGASVSVTFGGERVTTSADSLGRWRVELRPRPASATGVAMSVSSKNRIDLTGILVGDVWLGSGQSNMQWSLAATPNGKETAAAANNPTIRLLDVPRVKATSPAAEFNASWKVCGPNNAGEFSALLFHFGREIQRDINVPIGLIHSSWGGTAIDKWTTKGNQNGELYNGMIVPLIPFAIRGVIWMHGESNVRTNVNLSYRDNMVDLIAGWRKAWGTDIPFYYGQLPPYTGYLQGTLPEFWEAQAACLKIPNTGMAVTVDLVDKPNDIHSVDKLQTAKRLALWALAKSYEKPNIIYSGPIYKSMQINGDEIRLSFAHAKGLKSQDGGPLSQFEIAGADGDFVPATARIIGEAVVVKANGVRKPVEVRFAWQTLPHSNLVNAAGLPALPFRTKNWQGGTGE